MLQEIQNELVEIKQDFDARTQFCEVTATAWENGRCQLGGKVLDGAILTAVINQLTIRFPSVDFEATAVALLRQPHMPTLTVCTNLTGLHRRPSRISEQMNQLLNGWTVEPLFTEGSWTFVRQMDGYLGWVQSGYLCDPPAPPPTHMVGSPVCLLYTKADESTPLVGRVMGSTAVHATIVSANWARITLAGGRVGFARLDGLRPLNALPGDENGRRQQIIAAARQLLGVPYQWGGCTALGIDCSGLSQMAYRMAGITLPRDADMQMDAGQPVKPPFQPGDLLFFGSSLGHRSISHVGISVGGWHIIHSSGPRNGVYEDDVQTVDWLRETFVEACIYL
ncbi:MAG: C40 family peptidase [Ardenticatenaceae bacterium]|nr:C40 family peptidase [Ardenticatenaceae bacterium]